MKNSKEKKIPCQHISDHCFQAILDLIETKKTGDLSSPLFYEGQVPVVAYLVIKGHVVLTEGSNIIKVVKPGHIISLRELMNHEKSRYKASVAPHSEIGFLDKSTIKQLMDSTCSSETCELLSMQLEDHKKVI